MEGMTLPAYKYQTAAGKTMWLCSFYYQNYSGERIKKKKQGFSTKREADEYERDFLAKKTGSPSMTFKQLAENYLADARARVKPTTVESASNILRVHILPTFGATPIDAITPASVRQWENDELAAGDAVSSVATYKNEFSIVMNFACRFYGLASNPVRAAGPLKATGRKQQEKKLHFWTVDEFERFILSGLHPEYITVFSTLFWTGCRVGECLALTRRDIDFDAGAISINKNVEYIHGGYRAQAPKTPKSVRRVTMPKQLSLVLRDWIQQTDIQGPADMLFPFGIRGTIKNVIHAGAARAGLPAIRVHDLRHSHASMLVSLGFPPIVIRDRLGHSDIKTTMNIYSHLYPTAGDTVAARLGAI
ncbi:site-specific integrase [uncultured Selenomonas sp.]|uniref:site-specific integrase n=1 Tax=uncultured Selenomonas sp. TaxID=159275 RepID=UPI0025DDA278|nr:site-specific integrase [uncultured Selenomonas sp.]